MHLIWFGAMGADPLPTFLTVDELAVVLRCQPEKVYRLAAGGELPSYKVEGRRLFDQDEVVRSIQSYRTSKGERRYDVRYRDAQGRQRSRVFSVHKDAQAFKLDAELKQQAG